MMDEKDWAEFKRKLKAKTEIDLDLYKEPQMKRRIGNLVTRASMNSYVEYFDNAAKDKDDFAAFIEYLTINVSEFFRTPEKFGKLETDVIPDLLKRSPKLNIWSAGCSIGAEPYSLAIIMKEMTPNTRYRILASDLDIEMVHLERQGVAEDQQDYGRHQEQEQAADPVPEDVAEFLPDHGTDAVSSALVHRGRKYFNRSSCVAATSFGAPSTTTLPAFMIARRLQ